MDYEVGLSVSTHEQICGGSRFDPRSANFLQFLLLNIDSIVSSIVFTQIGKGRLGIKFGAHMPVGRSI